MARAALSCAGGLASFFTCQATNWAMSVVPKLKRYLDYYEIHHFCPEGYAWSLSYQSVFDNDIATPPFPSGSVSPCDLISWLLLEYRAMEQLVSALDQDTTIYARRSEELKCSIRTQYWNKSEDTFCARNLLSGRFQLHYSEREYPLGSYAHQSCSNLLPLFVGEAT